MSDIASTDIAIKIQNVWKIFGNTSKEALDAIQNKNISKQEALENFNSVIGVSNVSFDVKDGVGYSMVGLMPEMRGKTITIYGYYYDQIDSVKIIVK